MANNRSRPAANHGWEATPESSHSNYATSRMKPVAKRKLGGGGDFPV